MDRGDAVDLADGFLADPRSVKTRRVHSLQVGVRCAAAHEVDLSGGARAIIATRYPDAVGRMAEVIPPMPAPITGSD
jgi:hypothetical protein